MLQNKGQRQMAYAICELQNGLAVNGTWSRGALVVDTVDMSNERLLGLAFQKAFILERDVAKFPRVIIDGSLTKWSGLSTTHEFVKKVNSCGSYKPLFDFCDLAINESILIDRDVPAFIDFAHWTIKSNGTAGLETLAELVTAHLKGDVRHFPKYRWLANYFSVTRARNPSLRNSAALKMLEQG